MFMENNEEKVLYIKNMVCPRCVTVVRETLKDAGFTVHEVELGKAVVGDSPETSMATVNEKLQEHGFELIQEKDQQLVEQIKALLIQYVQMIEESEEAPKVSDYLAKQMYQNYSSLSSSFSQSEDLTIEKYIIYLKIERVKELLSYNELTLSEIAYKLNYSSVSYLSNQFKQITGMSVTDYKKATDSFRKPLDGLERD